MSELVPQSTPPTLTPEERAAQAQLRQSAGQIREVRDRLWTLHGQLGEQPGENDMAEGNRPWSAAFSIRGTIECVVSDDLDPAVRSLEETAREGSSPAPVTIRQAMASDLEEVYRLGLQFPELQPSSTSPFLDPEELPELFTDGLLLVAIGDGEELAGFLYAERRNVLGYVAFLAVAPEYQGQGTATALLRACGDFYRPQGVKRLGGFAYLGGGMLPFLASQGFRKGKPYVWMDREI